MFPKENIFLQFLVHDKDKKQKYHIVKHTNQKQFILLKRIAGNILSGAIPLKKTNLSS